MTSALITTCSSSGKEKVELLQLPTVITIGVKIEGECQCLLIHIGTDGVITAEPGAKQRIVKKSNL